MSLLELLLSEPSVAERTMGVLSSTPGQGLRPSGPGLGPGLGNVNQYAGDLPAQELALQIARKIERRPGFEVSGLEGFQGTGQITSGHIENSQHYSGMAGDVGYYGGGRFDSEPAALDWLENWLQQKYGSSLTELIWREPDHYDHLHYGTRPGG